MRTFKNLVPVIVFFLFFNFSSAQEITPEKYKNPEFYTITLINWEDGKMEAAKKIISEYLKPATEDAGQQLPMELDLLYSDWDYMAVFPMEQGMEAFEWKRSPADVKQMSALLKRVGSMEKVQEIWEEFGSYVKDSKNILARKTD